MVRGEQMKKTGGMNWVRLMVFVGIVLMVIVLIVPAVLVTGFSKDEKETASPAEGMSEAPEQEAAQGSFTSGTATNVMDAEPVISVFRSESENIEEVAFEDYIIGVVSAEMPAAYELEALKAQALTARTYILKKLTAGDELGLPEGADVTDTVMHQVFKSEDELRDWWGEEFEQNYTRVKQAVTETEGQVITFDGSPITASYFSTSNGFTENSEEYWAQEFPYLRSVESPWDVSSPRFSGKKSVTVAEFENLLGVQLSEGEVGEITRRTTGGRVAEVKVGGKEFSGREVRDLLALDSSDFSWTRSGDTIEFETRGWGHGVGMSQFGAHAMAQEGHTYREIIHHYYQGVEIEGAADAIGVALAAAGASGEDGSSEKDSQRVDAGKGKDS
jgi:stage II sporulation protein D